MKILHLIFIAVLLSSCAGGVKTAKDNNNEKKERFSADWASLQQYEVPTWFKDAKLGIFIHWGAYSVPEYGSEWYPRLMYMDSVVWSPTGELKSDKPNDMYKFHKENFGEPSQFGYKDFIPMFKGQQFNANEWMDLFEKAGAKYIVPVAEHHDGFAMYNSKHTRWNSVNMGPNKDILGDLTKVARDRGMKIGASSHFAFNWNYYTYKEGFDTMDPEYSDLYSRPHDHYAPADKQFLEHWWERTADIIDSYQPDILWFDFYIDREEFVPYHPKLAAYYYNKALDWNKEVVLQTKNFKFDAFPEGTNVLDIERGKMSDIRKEPWQTDTSIGKNSWGYVKNWISKEPNTIVDDLVDIVSKNGCLLLNVGPNKEGVIPQDQQEVLLELGNWLAVNGDAIYESRPWVIFGEGPTKVSNGHHSEGNNEALTADDFRYTVRDGKLYAISMAWPKEGNKVTIPALKAGTEYINSAVSTVKLLGADENLKWSITPRGLEVELPNEKPCKYAYSFEVSFEEDGALSKYED